MFSESLKSPSITCVRDGLKIVFLDYHVVNIRHAWIFLLPLFPSQFSRCLLHMIGCSSQAPPTPENPTQPSSREMWHHAPSTPTREQNTVTPQFTSRGQQVQPGASGSVWSTEDNDCPALWTCSVFIINESVLFQLQEKRKTRKLHITASVLTYADSVVPLNDAMSIWRHRVALWRALN